MNFIKWIKNKKKEKFKSDFRTEERVMEGNPYVKAKLQLLKRELEKKILNEKNDSKSF